ncbi:putative phage tail protein [Peptostreptococcus anaerobius]|uniref:putative phage tail protein n=1 Tax=Peptostreptococcus anaerobius TaxID=1261 RepID=UPI0029050A2A|nr:putative phage tail protein [Peptostreptococcus anaerobius]MDU1599153.1 putative phage tail protein [Peptostreptococcus anaerobius]MDU1663960.1 putative phage tail protein [Peptoniphilus harei]MDU1682238.1 putative phage tail protein [Peptostreptococcus anaerobius]
MFNLIELYPDHLQNKTISEISKVEQYQLELEEKAIDNLIREFFIDTATFSLDTWAKFAGIEDNPLLDLDIRRSNIKAALKSKEVTTVEVIKSIAESYSNGTCEVIEDYANYNFTVKFTGTVGVPSRIDEIRKIIDKVKPAHLDYDFEFKYRTWNDIKALGKTWGYWKSLGKTWKDLREGVL